MTTFLTSCVWFGMTGRTTACRRATGVQGSRRRPHTVSATVFILAAVGLLATSCVLGTGKPTARTPGAGEVARGVRDCDSFEGVFESRGRLHPEFDLDDPLPGKPPGTSGWRNSSRLSEVLGCDPDCELGLDSRSTSFALRFEDDHLRWAVLHEPTHRVVYHGRVAMRCEAGVLARQEDLRVSMVGHLPFARGDSSDIDVLVIDEQGRLIRNRVRDFRGTVFVILPIATRWNDGWRDFAPTGSSRDLDELFDSLAETGEGETVRLVERFPTDEGVEGGEGRAAGPGDRVHRLLLSDYGDTLPRERVAMSLRWALVTVRRESLSDGYYASHAHVTVQGPNGLESLHLVRSHAPKEEPVFVRVFDVEVALDIGYPTPGRPRASWPAQALILVRPVATNPR